MSNMVWTPQQLAIFEHGEQSRGSLNVIARAGTGKTTTIVELARRVKGKVFLGAFNKSIADELAARVTSNPRCTASTFHSIGFRLLKEIRPKAQVDNYKVSSLARALYPYDKKIREAVCDAVGFAKLDGLGLDGLPAYTDLDAWTELFDGHDLWDDVPGGISPERILNDCVTVFKKSLEMCESKTQCVIDFSDMLYAPLYLGSWKPQRYDWVMMDEAQDTNETRLRLAQSILVDKGAFVAVGDPAQCQPTGTNVAVVLEKSNGKYQECVKYVPIESIKVGDVMISYRTSGSYFRKCNRVVETAKRKYVGNLVKVRVGKAVSKYTENHHCLVNFKPLLDQYGVYLMRRGQKFRVGYSKLSSGLCAGGPRSRMKAESGEQSWLLCVLPTKREARDWECIISANYGLPQLMFTPKNNSAITSAELDFVWSKIEVNYERAVRCLLDFGRDVRYPLFTAVGNWKQSLKRPIAIHAVNIVNGCLMLPYNISEEDTTDCHTSDWKPVKVSREHYEGYVYSLEVENDHTYCADGIMTHNCIFQFAGANNNAMDRIKEATGAIELPLSVTYRCPKVVVEMAQSHVPDYEAAPTNSDGKVESITHTQLWSLCQKLDPAKSVILCRMTRPLVGMARRLRGDGIPCIVEGNNGKAILSLLAKWGLDMTWGEYTTRLDDYAVREAKKLRAKGKEEKAEYVEEKAAILYDIADNPEPDTQLRVILNRTERMFGQGQGQGQDNSEVLRLCSVHRSKGREWDTVVLVGKNRYMPSPWAETEEDHKAEANVEYVAITRTKHKLVLVEVPPKPKKGEGGELEWWEV